MLEFSTLQQYEKKLEKANSIIKEIAANIKNISPIISSDYLVFDDFFDQEKKPTYGNSWLYVTQGTFGIGPEKLGYKYYDGKNLCTLAIFPKIEQPDIIMLYWIRPLGEDMLSIIANLAKKIKQQFGISSYVKKLFPEQYEFLLQHGFHSTKEFPWHSSAHSEDDTYPELIYDREKTLEAVCSAPRRSRLGSSFRNVARTMRKNVVTFSSANFECLAWEIVNTFFSEYHTFANKPNVSTPFDYYNLIFGRTHGDGIEKKIVLADKKPIGFYVLKRDKKTSSTNPYGIIVLRRSYKNLTDCWYFQLFENENVRYINLGGSEDTGIHNFKDKYQPIKKNPMYWATNYFS